MLHPSPLFENGHVRLCDDLTSGGGLVEQHLGGEGLAVEFERPS